ncbi:hypothetical protein AB0D04_27835 [Streptomyces sp. NPDC048483]|uniref:hypothetical protein n=1 Tax=Streptomyces sp. NPDC048483 TaxID=3154927 RepID=UPI00341CE142
MARTPDKTTLYLGDKTEISLAKGAERPEATRYMPLGGGHQAVLADDGSYTITLADHHATGQLAITTNDLAMVQRRALPSAAVEATAPRRGPEARVSSTASTTPTSPA